MDVVWQGLGSVNRSPARWHASAVEKTPADWQSVLEVPEGEEGGIRCEPISVLILSSR